MYNEEKPKTFYFQWHVIETCNLRCAHCYQESFAFKDLPDDQIMKIAHIMEVTLEKWKRSGRVSLTGGEPFLRKDLLLKLLDFFEKSDHFYWVGILTNGTLIDEPTSDALRSFVKLKEIQVSIDGAEARTHDAVRGRGSFEKAVKAVQLLKQKGFTVSIMFTLHKQNQAEAVRMIGMAEKLDVDFLTIERVVPNKKKDILEQDQLKAVYESVYKKKLEVEKRSGLKVRVSRPLWCLVDENAGGFCPAGFTSLAILHDGTLLPCRRLEIPIGNILEDGIFKPWYTSEVLWKLRNKNLLGGKCSGCRFLGNCGGCRAVAYKLTGDSMSADPQCWKNGPQEDARR
jgi:radical SAM protein with 4Fe4S-binding SPASM domain